jgi:hypothetical protein
VYEEASLQLRRFFSQLGENMEFRRRQPPTQEVLLSAR